MLINVACLLISFIPMLILYFWMRNLKNDEAHRQKCRKLLISGIIATIGVTVFALLVNIAWALSGLNKISKLLNDAFHDFILAALIEEAVKQYYALKQVRVNRDTVSWLDVTVWSGIVGIGFGLAEDVIIAINNSPIVILVRGITALHVCYGMMMGYFIGKSYRTGKKRYAVLGFVLSWLLHGMYDFSLSPALLELNDNLVFLPFILVIITIVIGIRVIRIIKKGRSDATFTDSLFKKAE